MIAWENFTPEKSALGGALIGLAAVAMVLFTGRILGISGIVARSLWGRAIDRGWDWAFLVGLVCSPWVAKLIHSGLWVPPMDIDASYPLLIVAGLLVGCGTRYGSGCTSGHGVCGLSRLSLRSLVATMSFMLAGGLVVYLMRHLLT